MFALRIAPELELREFSTVHAAELFALIEANRAHLREWLPWLDDTTRIQHVERFIREGRRQSEQGNGRHFMLMFEGRIAGVAGQHYVDRVDRKTEFGYWLDAGRQGKGLMTHAVARLVLHAFEDLDLNRIILNCAVGNLKSRALAERLGFTLEGVLREAQWLYDHYTDLALYALLRKDWRPETIPPPAPKI